MSRTAAVMPRGGEEPARRLRRARESDALLCGRLLGRLGTFEVRLAASAGDIRLAQELRYRIFHEARGRQGSFLQQLTRLDEDRFDRHCDHLLLVDTSRGPSATDRMIGTYRLLTQEAAREAGSFYGQAEFDVEGLVRRHPARRFLELGRSCILPDGRGRRTMELLWHGVWAYVLAHRIDVLFGCASLPGTSLEALAAPLGFLKVNAVAPAEWRAAPVAGRGSALTECDAGDPARALAALPPLVKAYLRLGGLVSDNAVVDHDFGTTDLLLVLPLERIAPRYVDHYGAAAERFR